MKIAISATGKDLNANVEPRFGRCSFFAIYIEEENKWIFLANPGALEGSGAGIKAAQFLGEQGVDVLLTGELGPKASRLLDSLGIDVFAPGEVTLEEALKQYKAGKAKPIKEATVNAQAGITFSYEIERQKAELETSKKKVAIATDGIMVAQHFGRCPSYTIFEINNGTFANKTVIQNPGHQPGFLPRFLAEKGVNCVIAGGMGPRAQNLFVEQGIDTIVGVTGSVEEIIKSYLNGTLTSGESFCEHGQDGQEHDCQEH